MGWRACLDAGRRGDWEEGETGEEDGRAYAMVDARKVPCDERWGASRFERVDICRLWENSASPFAVKSNTLFLADL